MGKHLISTLLTTLIAILGIELFVGWYRNFLKKRRLPQHLQRAIEQILWVLLSLILWNALYRKFMPAEFDGSHLLFALFIFSLRGLFLSLVRKPEAR